MQLEAHIDARLVEGLENRQPTPAEFIEGRLDEVRGALRPGIEQMPGERTGKRGVRGEPEAAARLGGEDEL